MRAIAIVGLLVGLATATAARAEQLRVCFEEWAPFAMIDDGQAGGLMIEIMDRAFAAAGHTANYSQQPYLRCIANVRGGSFDAMLMTSDEQGLAPTTISVAFWEVGVIAKPDWPHDSYTSLQDFAGATVGLVSGYEYHPVVKAAVSDWNVQYVHDARFNLRKLASGRIDVTIADVPWAQLHAGREGLRFKVLSPMLFATPQNVYFHPSRSAVAAGIDTALRGLIADGTVDRLYERAFGVSFRAVQQRAAAALVPR